MVFIFAKQPSDSLAGLVKAIDKVVAKNKDSKMAAVLNFTGEPSEDFVEQTEEFGKDNNIENVALMVTSDGDRFQVSEDADVTVMHYSGKKVKYNYAAKGELSEKEIAAIVKGTEKILK